MRVLAQAVAVMLAIVVVVGQAMAETTAATGSEELLSPRSMGSADAPVEIVEHSSLTCPHCASFHAETLPKIKETYIDTGKARLVYQDYPIGGLAFAAAMVAHCVPPSRYFGFIDMVYAQLESWTQSQQPMESLEAMGRLAGLSEAEFQACLENQQLFDSIQQRAKAAQTEKGVESTPTFFINGRRVVGAQPYAAFAEIIDEELNKSP